MSLILDALRKSEAERRRGEAPSLYSGLPTPGTRRRPSALRYLPWVVVAVLVAVALFAFRKDDAPATKEELTQQSSVADDASTSPSDAGFETATAVVSATPASTTPPPRPHANANTPPPALPRTANVDSLVRTPAPPAAAPAAPAPAAPAPAAPMPSAAMAPTPAPAPAPDADSGEEQLPPLGVLDATTRGTLPALKLSMHFYSSDPARRFAIIDGQRVVEGAVLGAGVVTQIRRDGVVIEVGGRRVLVPRP